MLFGPLIDGTQLVLVDVETGLGTLELAAIRAWPLVHNGFQREGNVVIIVFVEKSLQLYVA